MSLCDWLLKARDKAKVMSVEDVDLLLPDLSRETRRDSSGK